MTTVTDANQIVDRLDEARLRVGKIVHLAAMLGDAEMMDGDLHEFLTFEADALLDEWGYYDDDHVDRDVLAETLYDDSRLGWILKVHTPVLHHLGDSEIHSFSWGHTYTTCVYADSYDDALDKAVAWAEERQREDKAASR